MKRRLSFEFRSGLTLSGERSLSYLFLFLCLSLIAISCDRKGREENANAAIQEIPEKPTLCEVNAARIAAGELLFQYLDGEGNWQRAFTIEEIPASARGQVQVVDLKRSPEERQAQRFVQLFDLQRAEGEQYVGQVIERSAFDAAQTAARAALAPPPVIMYSASWCGVCKRARRFLTRSQIPFEEKDIERDPGARRELEAKARRAGVSSSGVPVFDVAGQIMSGFDPSALLRAVGRGEQR